MTPQPDPNAVKECVKRDLSYTSPSGVDCFFVEVGVHWGIKLYETEGERDRAFKRQSAVAEINRAPAVGEKIDLPKKEGGTFLDGYRFGYITEKVTIPASRLTRLPFIFT